MTAIYTKDGLTVHFPSENFEDIDFTVNSLLTTACLAIENAPSNIDESEKGSISKVIRFVSEILPTENEYKLMLSHKDNDLKTSLSELGIK